MSRSSNSPRYFAPATSAHVECHDALALQALGHVSAHDPLCEPFDNRRFADTWRANQHGVVLSAPGKDLNDPSNLVVTADDRVQLALASERRQIPPILLEGFVGALGSRARDTLSATHCGDRLQQPVVRQTGGAQGLHYGTVLETRDREQDVLDADVLVFHSLCFGFSTAKHLIDTRRDVDLSCRSTRPGHTRHASERLLERLN